MRDEMNINPADRELESALRGLKPVASAVDPIGCAFDAGRASMRRQNRTWQGACAALLVCVGALATLRTGQAPQQPSDPGVYAAATPTASPDSYLLVRNRVLQDGLGALPSLPAGNPVTPPRAGGWDL